MKKFRLRCVYIVFIILVLTPSTFAAFTDIGVGARPLGLGGAFVALADDSNATYYNPAGLAYIDKIQFGATYAQRFNGLVNYNTIGGIIPVGGLGTLGANIGLLAEDSGIYREQTIRFSYGRTLIKQLGFGLNIKMFGTSFDDTNEFVIENPYFAQTSSSAVSLDLGLLTKPINSLSLGVSVENILPADISVYDTDADVLEIETDTEDTVPLNIRAGIVYDLESIAEMSAQGAAITNLLKSTLVAVEVVSRDSETYTRFGIEMWVNNAIGVRCGYGMKNTGNPTTTLSLGGSAKIPISSTALQLDYGFQLLTGDLQDNTTQRFSVNLLF